MLRIASGTRTQRADDEAVEYGNGHDGLVNSNFKAVDAMISLVRVGDEESTWKRCDSDNGAARQEPEPAALDWHLLDESEKVGERHEGCCSCRPGNSCVRIERPGWVLVNQWHGRHCNVDSEARMPATARADARDLQELVPQTCYRSRTQFIERLVDIPVLQQRQAPTAQTAQESMEMSQEQFLDKVVDMPVVVQRQVLMVQTVQKTLECRVEIASRVDDLQHDRSGEPTNGGNDYREDYERHPGETLPGSAVHVGTLGRQVIVAS